jgi:hypothetical protein
MSRVRTDPRLFLNRALAPLWTVPHSCDLPSLGLETDHAFDCAAILIWLRPSSSITNPLNHSRTLRGDMHGGTIRPHYRVSLHSGQDAHVCVGDGHFQMFINWGAKAPLPKRCRSGRKNSSDDGQSALALASLSRPTCFTPSGIAHNPLVSSR